MDTAKKDIEIELKFLVSQKVIGQIPAIITEFAKTVINKPSRNLQNAYFDTASRELRALDIGLRTRCYRHEHSCDENCEQTIKLAGQVIGGLHQRPEYNLPLSGHRPDLTQFDADIWPHGMQVTAINDNIYPIFSTNFIRRTWIIETQSGAKIELVLDKGEICADKRCEAISEVEMELISGERAELFSLAKKLLDHSEVRLGLYSKAARGYMLADLNPLTCDSQVGCVKLPKNCTQEQAFIACFQYGIAFVQKHEQCYFESPSLNALKRVIGGLCLIRHTLWLFEDFVDKNKMKAIRDELKWLLNELSWVETAVQLKNYTSKKHAYYKKINNAPELSAVISNLKSKHPNVAQIKEIFHSSRYNHLILSLTMTLVDKKWRQDWSGAQALASEQKVIKTAPKLFEKYWLEMQQLILKDKDIPASAYIDKKQKLERNLLSGCCLGSLFDPELRDVFRAPWLDIIYGIDELNTLHNLKQLCINQTGADLKKIENWLEQKSLNLVAAMEQSRLLTFKLTPYWR